MSRNKVFWAAQARQDMTLDLQTETIVDFRISGTLQTGAVRKPPLLFYRLVGAASNCAVSTHIGAAGNRTYLWTAVNLMHV